MKKTFFLMVVLIAFLGLPGYSFAQTAILDGLITVSDGENEVWYYIENGHNGSNGIISDNDGRFCALLTVNGNSDGTAIAGMPLQSVSERDGQLWKVVSTGNGDYYLINKKNGEYVKQTSANTMYDTTNEVSEAHSFSFTNSNNDASFGTFVKIENNSISSNKKLEMSNGGTGNVAVTSWRLTNTNSGDPVLNTVTDAGLTGSPRAWRFVPAADIDDFYPTVYDEGTPVESVKEWFYIKSLDKDINGNAKYMTISESGLVSLQEKAAIASDEQLFGFVSGGVYRAGTSPGSMGTHTQIVHKATGKYIGLNSSDNYMKVFDYPMDWYLKHVYSPRNVEQPIQGVIRTQRNSGEILTNNFHAENVKTSNFVDTYDNTFTWAYELAVFDLEVNFGADIGQIYSLPKKVNSGEKVDITYLVSGGCVPVVEINGVRSAVGTQSGAGYSLSLIITANTTVNITADTPEYEIAANAGSGVTITSPTLQNGKYSSSSTSVIAFTLENGYHMPHVFMDGQSFPVTTHSDGTYTYTLSDITEDKTLTIVAFPDNQIPVLADTYVNGRDAAANYSKNNLLFVQYATDNYARRSYLEFDPTTFTGAAKYNKAYLNLVVDSIQTNGKTGKRDPFIQVRTVPANLPAIDAMTWSANGEAGATPKGDAIGSEVGFSKYTPAGSIISMDVSDYVLGNLTESSLRIQVAGSNGGSSDNAYDGNIYFHSLEGAISAQDAGITPVLVFKNEISLTTSTGVNVQIPSGTGPYEISVGEDFTATFTLDEGYHMPMVTFNGEPVSITENGNQFSVTFSNLQLGGDVSIMAFPENTLPVKADTYVVSGQGNKASNEDLWVQYSNSATYVRRSYLEFDASQMTGYSKASLQLVLISVQKTGNAVVEARSVPETFLAIDQMTFSTNSEAVAAKGNAISSPVTFSSSNVGQVISFDVTDYVIENLSSSLRIQLSGTSAGNDGTNKFYSLEGALSAGDMTLIPVLVFEAASNKWTGAFDTDWNNIANWNGTLLPEESTTITIPANLPNYPAIAANTIVGGLIMEDGAEVKLADGITLTVTGEIKVEKTVDSFKWYPVGFPFNASVYYNEFQEDPELVLYNPDTAGANGDFWLKEYNGTEFNFVTDYPMLANKGYIAQYPSFFQDKTITYTSGNGKTITGGVAITPATTEYVLVSNPSLASYTVNSVAPTYFYTYDSASGNFTLVNGALTLQPFEAVITVSTDDPATLRSLIGDGDYTGLETPAEGNKAVKEIRYYNLQGVQVIRLVEGEIYIERKIYEDGEEKTGKFIQSTKSKQK